MVAKEVEIISKSQKSKSTPVRWTCDGSPKYTMEETKRRQKEQMLFCILLKIH